MSNINVFVGAKMSKQSLNTNPPCNDWLEVDELLLDGRDRQSGMGAEQTSRVFMSSSINKNQMIDNEKLWEKSI
jgi:hypothetical protein